MKIQALLFLVAMAGFQLTQAQDVTDCLDISFGLGTATIDPVTVPDLPVCVAQRAVAQCCSTQFIVDQLNATEENFLEGLRAELEERFQNFLAIVAQLRQFVSGNLLPNYFASIGNLRFLNGANGLVNGALSQFLANLDFTPGDDDDDEMEMAMNMTEGFSVRSLLNNLVSGVATAVGDQFAGGPNVGSRVRQCIRRVIEDQVQQQKLNIQAGSLQQIRRVIASFDNITNFVRNFTDNLAGFRPLQQCIETVVRLNTCGRCVAVRPPFCENVCEAIASACYSPFNDALENQFEQLWETVRRIIDAANGAIVDLNVNKGLLNVTTMTSEISTQCQVSIAVSRVGRQSDDDDDEEDDVDIPAVPGLLRAAAQALAGGPFDYEDREMQGSGLCRLLNTSSMNCWNGTAVVAQDITEFDDDDIIDQVNNPVISIPQQTLMEQATSLGTPVTMALNSPAFAEVAPVGLVIPDAGAGGPAPGNNGAATMFLTVTSLLLMLTVSIFVL